MRFNLISKAILFCSVFTHVPSYALVGNGGIDLGGGISSPIRSNVRVTNPRLNVNNRVRVNTKSPSKVSVGPTRVTYNSHNYHRPYGHRHYRYYYYSHDPYYYHSGYHHHHYSHGYYYYMRDEHPNYFYVHWYFYPTKRPNGYVEVNGYPYYSFNGYLHRYSAIERCNYQLVNGYNHKVKETYWDYTCQEGYNLCAVKRDRLNRRARSFKYFCAETFREQESQYVEEQNRTRTHNIDFSRDCDDYDPKTNTCYDVK